MADMTRLLTVTIECVGNFYKPKEMDVQILCGAWCWRVTDFGVRDPR